MLHYCMNLLGFTIAVMLVESWIKKLVREIIKENKEKE